jgi:uncharacterized protein (DUF486 family)
MPVLLSTVALLVLSNVFMTFAWYGHLGTLRHKAVYIAVAVSWGIALVEYAFQVPANRIGYRQYSLSQLKILQEVISLSVFVPVAVLFLKERFKWDYVWAAVCVAAAVFFVFRSRDEADVPAPADPPAQSAPVNTEPA